MITSDSDINKYKAISNDRKNLFIIKFPTMKLFKENGQIKVKTRIELYSAQTNEILLSKENIGIPKAGLTDYPMCSGDNWDCAIVNSVYPSLIDILKTISDKNTYKK